MPKTPSPPPPPDPVATANAQGQMNRETAIAQARLNNVNQTTPWGSLVYTQGEEVNGVPQWTATQQLSPEQQKLYDLNTQTQTTLGQIGVDQSGKVKNILNTPFDLNAATSNQQADMRAKLYDPVWQKRQAAEETRLANQGIQQGSEAYTNAMRDFGMQRDNSYTSAALSDRAQATQEALTNRNQPLNEIAALMSGSQVSQPSFVGTPQTSVAPVDYTGLVNNNYQGQMAAYNTRMQNQGGLFGALGGMAGTALGGWGSGGFKFSDRRLKTDIKPVATLDNGLTVYLYRFKSGGPFELGLMADEVERVNPFAVKEIGGIKHVNYEAALRG